VIKDFVKLKKYNLQSLVPPEQEAQKSSKSNTTGTSGEKAAAKVTKNDGTVKPDDSQTVVSSSADTSDCQDKTDTGDHDSQLQTSVSAADTSDHKDATDTGDRATASKIADTTSDKITGVADESVKTVFSDTNVAKSTEYSGASAEVGSSPTSTETSSRAKAGESTRTGNEN
jgi:hypothetical protein